MTYYNLEALKKLEIVELKKIYNEKTKPTVEEVFKKLKIKPDKKPKK